jgi:hypothetical protein
MQTVVRLANGEAFCEAGKECPQRSEHFGQIAHCSRGGTLAVHFMPGHISPVHISVASPAGAYTVGNTSFFRYILRLAEVGLHLHGEEREALEMLSAIPHAFFDDDELTWGKGWRVIPPASLDDWPVLESTPQRVRAALETARRILWENAAPVGITAREIVAIEDELDAVFSILERAEQAGFPVNISYVS